MCHVFLRGVRRAAYARQGGGMADSQDPGHLFIVQGDLTQVAVDAAIVPCDADQNFHRGFAAFFGESTRGGSFCEREYVRPLEQHVIGVEDSIGLWAYRKGDGGSAGSTHVFLLETSNEHGGLNSLLDRMKRAIRHISSVAEASAPGKRPSIALTLPGVHAGGFRDRYAAAARGTLECLAALAGEAGGPDLVMVLARRADYAALQYLRRQLQSQVPCARNPEWAPAFDIARQLAEFAAHDSLTLFIGAGASAGSGLPDWQGLLLGATNDPELRRAIKERRIEMVDVAAIIEKEELPEDFKNLVAHSLDSSLYSLTQAMLTSLRIPEAITTNFDRSYESAHSEVAVFPRAGKTWSRPWLLKLHGDVERPDTMVLTREDYVRLEMNSAPTASILQSRMMTSHVLFVGYSVSDENVIRLARQVQQFRLAHGTGGVEPIGTVLGPRFDKLKARLWSDVLRFVELPDNEDGGRNVLVFLDHLAMHASSDIGFLLNDKYGALLTPDDLAIKESLGALLKARRAVTPSDSIRDAVDNFLGQLGKSV